MDPITGLDEINNRKLLTLPEFELRVFGRLASSQSLYRLSYHLIYTASNGVVTEELEEILC
jgi:hypothetical protein